MAPKRVRSPVSATEKTRRLFRFQGKSIFLTYAQTYFTADYLLVELRRLCNDRSRLRYIRVATEQHRDGNTHFHVLIQLHKKLDTKDVNLFDIPKDPSVGPPIHPNWQLPRRDSDVFAYISKHGDYIEEGELNPLQRSPKKHRDDIWESIITSSNSATEFLELTLQMQPFHAANNWERLKAFAADRWPKPPQQYEAKFHTFGNLPEPLQRWVDRNVYTVSESAIRQITNNPFILPDINMAHNLTQEEFSDQYIAYIADAQPDVHRIQSFDNPPGLNPSSSRDHREPGRQSGQDPSDDTTTSADTSISENTTSTHNTTSSTTSSSDTAST
ncbi:TPA_asm: RepA [Welwitschia mirabilis associated geminivirus A]|nr:TPA_asm: RepA [Welwitschia mirabilis associated geminivirus A]